MGNVLSILLMLAFAGPADDVKGVLNTQTEAWNRGDLPTFVSYYSPESIFVGKEVTRGNAGILERYRKSYSTKAKMGVLEFTDLEVKMLGADYASVIGRFHLKRTAEGGGDSSGIFTLLLKKTGQGWRIVLDHTS